MRDVRFLLALASGLLLAGAPCRAQVAPQITLSGVPSLPEKNLVKNPEFTAHDGDKLVDWQWMTATPSNFEVGWAPVGRTAPGAAWIKTHTGSMSGYWYQYVPVTAGDRLMISCWVRTSGGQVLLYITGDVQPPGGQRYGLDERAMLSSIKSSPLAPVWIKREYLRGPDPEVWSPLCRVLTIPAGLKVLAVHIGSYFMRGEMWADDMYVGPPQVDVSVRVRAAPGGELRRIRVLTDKGQTLHDSGDLAPGTTTYQQALPGQDAEAGCSVQVTAGDGKVTRSPRFPPVP